MAIAGATGVVGQTMLGVLAERRFPVSQMRLMSSARSAGRSIETAWGEVVVEELATADPSGVDVALFSAGAERARRFAPGFADRGALVVDNSSAFRMDQDVPLVVAGVNDEAVRAGPGIVANPNCTTMALMMAAGPLHRSAGLKSMVVSSYQSVSGSGRGGIEALTSQTEHFLGRLDTLLSGGWEDPDDDTYARPIGFNVVPLAGTIGDDGYTDEEWKLVNESRKILSHPDLEVEPTCVRVPVVVGHAINATLRFSRPVEVDEAEKVLAEAEGIELWRDRVPTPLDSTGVDEVLVGRVRSTLGSPGGINLWVVGDNLRKGAALNAVQIAELAVA